MKIFGTGLDRFTVDISHYRMVAAPFDAVAAYVVSWTEVIAGVCLLLGILRKGAILTVAALVGVFSLSIGWAWYHKLDISCGCHGSDAPIRYWFKAAELAGYFVVLAGLWWVEKISPQEEADDVIPGDEPLP